ncbi:MAG: hypothetical protein ACK2U9_24920 [Anaerolineae bacterium]|jgi:CubicO group peptidase (beta-lactamase class C family)
MTDAEIEAIVEKTMADFPIPAWRCVSLTAAKSRTAWALAWPGRAQAVQVIAIQELLFDPGSSWSYSGPGLAVLGALVARISGEP